MIGATLQITMHYAAGILYLRCRLQSGKLHPHSHIQASSVISRLRWQSAGVQFTTSITQSCRNRDTTGDIIMHVCSVKIWHLYENTQVSLMTNKRGESGWKKKSWQPHVALCSHYFLCSVFPRVKLFSSLVYFSTVIRKKLYSLLLW